MLEIIASTAAGLLALAGLKDSGTECFCRIVYGTHEECRPSTAADWYEDVYRVCNKCGNYKFLYKRQKGGQ